MSHWGRVVAGARVLAVLLVVGALLGAAALGQAATDGQPPRGPNPNDPAVAGQVAAGKARAAAWEAAHPEPSEQEVQESRSAHLDLSAEDALATAKDAFPGWLTSPVLVGGLPLSSGQRVERFVGTHAAMIAAPGGRHAAVRSTLPLLGRSPVGEEAPIDLRLQSVAGGFAPRSSASQVVMPSRASDEIRFLDKGFGLRFAGAKKQAGKLTDDRVFYANVYGRSGQTDAMLQAKQTGVEVSYQIRGGSEDQVLEFDLPEGGRLVLHGPRPGQQGVTIEDASGGKLGVVLPPAAIDATGRRVPTSYSLDGPDRLVMHVRYKDGNYKLPVLADPLVASWSGNIYGSWGWGANGGPFTADTYNGYARTHGPSIIGQGGHNQYAAYSMGAINGAYIYQLYNYSVWHYPNNSQEYGGLWEPNGFGTPGTWQDTVPSHGSGPGGSGWPASRYQSGQESYINTVYCGQWGNAANCQPPAHFAFNSNVPNNVAQTAGVFLLGAIGAGYVPRASTYGAYLYESDDQLVTLQTPGHSGFTPATWSRTFSAGVGLTASAPSGLGMKRVFMTGPVVRSSTNPCSSYPCSLSQTANFTYSSTSLPEGISTLTAQAESVSGMLSNTRTWTAKVDRSQPATELLGTLWNSPGDRIARGTHTLVVNATDGVRGGTDAQRRSGVERIILRVGEAGTTPQKVKEVPPDDRCLGDSCPLTLDYTLDTSQYEEAEGETQLVVRVETTDKVGNPVKVDEKTVTIASAYSGSCSSESAAVFDGYAGNSTYVRLRSQPDPADDEVTWVCYRASNGGSTMFGGRVEVASGSVDPGSVGHDELWETCAGDGNTSPVPHPVPAGQIGDPDFPNEPPPYTPYQVDTYANSDEAWVCMRVGSFVKRVKVPLPSVTVPGMTVHQDAPPHPPLPDPEEGPVGYPSSTCQSGLAGPSQQVLNADVGAWHVWAYTAQPTTQKAHVCVRAQGSPSVGGQLVIDGSPGIGQTVLTTSDDMAPCEGYVTVFNQSSPQVTIKRTPTGQNPTEVCVTAAGASKRIVVDANGSLIVPLVTWTPDP